MREPNFGKQEGNIRIESIRAYQHASSKAILNLNANVNVCCHLSIQFKRYVRTSSSYKFKVFLQNFSMNIEQSLQHIYSSVPMKSHSLLFLTLLNAFVIIVVIIAHGCY